MEKIIFKVEGLDCQEECSLLDKALKPEEGIKELSYDVISGCVTITYDPSAIDSKRIQELIHSTGMRATEAHQKSERSHGRALLCLLSALFLLAGLITHWISHPSLSDILGIAVERESLPIPVILLYLSAMVSGSWYVLPKAYASIRHLRPDMNLLMVVAIIGAMILGQWFEGATVAFLFSLSLLLEHWSVERARRAIGALLDLTPALGRVIKGEQIIEKHVEEIQEGEIILIRPGERIPLDGLVVKGSSSVNQAPITGESLPAPKQKGDPVFAGTLNEEGALECRVTKRFSDTTLARIIEMVQEARARKAKSEQWVERFARVYTPLMMGLALLIALLPPLFFGGEWATWVYRALVVLVIACPCALVISTPVSIVSALTAAARRGLLIKGGVYLEAAGRVDAIAFDKTGTLTMGHPVVQRVIPLDQHTEQELLEIAAALEKSSEHPIARAILKKAAEKNIRVPHAEEFRIFKGLGAEGTVAGTRYWIGSHRFMHDRGGETPQAHKHALEMEDAGHSVVAIGDFHHICGLISVADSPRPFVKQTLQALRSLGAKKLIMLTGDNQATASSLAKEVGITAFRAELLPEDKVQIVRELTKEFRVIAMVGDGINDAPALAASHLGIAMGGAGSDAAFETADIVLMADDLSHLPRLIRHARRTLKIIKQNISLSLGLKALFLILAMVGLSSLWMAIAADTGASLVVVLNGLRLLKYEENAP